MGTLLNVPYIKQPKNSPKCGAACAAMIIEFYKGEYIDLNSIWDHVKDISPELNREYCKTHKIGTYISENHFNCCIVKYTNLKDFLVFCNTNGIAPILNHKSYADRKSGHFSVVKNISSNAVLINDPENKKTNSVSYDSLALLSKKNEDINSNDEIGGNTAITPILNKFTPISIPCPYCGRSIDISFSRAANSSESRIVDADLCLYCDRFIPIR